MDAVAVARATRASHWDAGSRSIALLSAMA
jgi:hypothetical protein